MRLLPEKANTDARVLVLTRSVRAFVDGIAFVVLPAYLIGLGFSGVQIGTVVAASLLGSAVLTLAAGSVAHRHGQVTLLRAACAVMIVTGIAFGLLGSFVALVVVGVVTTMNTSSGDVSPFLPLEQSILSGTVPDADRTSVFARYNLFGSLVGAAGALCAGVPVWLARSTGHAEQTGRQGAFVLYGLAGFVLLAAYSRLSPLPASAGGNGRAALSPGSRRIVLRLAALFSLDSLGGGFATQAIFAIWVFGRFGLSVESLGVVFFAAGILSAFSSLLSVRVAARIGLVRTMVFTHIPASLLLVLVALSPNLWTAMTLFVLRGLLSQMDVPVRTSYVMAVVAPAERAAAASITNVPRSLASALPPVLAGWMLDMSGFGWPLIICAACKITYDVLLLLMFRDVRPPEEL
ncbi:MAG: MFS transporter [Actinomycetota bacterium]